MWFRFEAFTLAQRTTNPLVLSDILLDESEWQNPQANVNDAQRGGARLERLIVEAGLNIEAAAAWSQTSGNANIAYIPELLIWKQSDQFGTIVTDDASFDQTVSNQRVICNQMMMEKSPVPIPGTNDLIRVAQTRYETKSKVRLADSALGVAIRCPSNFGAGTVRGFTDWVRPTMLISAP